MPEFSSNQPSLRYKTKAQSSPGLFAPKSFLNRLASISIDLLFPPRCVGCGRIDTSWCTDCQQDMDKLAFPDDIGAIEPLSAVMASAWHTDKIREAVQALKYENARAVAKPLGKRLAQCLQKQQWIIDIVVPVPLHTKRLAERGYNQAQLLAEQVAIETEIYCEPAALQRVRETKSQVTISGAERLTNITGAFAATNSLINGQIVLIIDDVYTTGSTMRACGEALLLAGAQSVYGLTVTAAGHSFTHKKETVDEHYNTRA